MKKNIHDNLHGNWEVILSFWWKEDVDGFLGKRLIALRRLSDLDHMQLSQQHIIDVTVY